MAQKKIKKKKTKERKQEVSSVEKEQNKVLISFFVVVLLVFGSMLIGYLYFQELNKFSYAGVDFEKIKDQGLEYYHGKTPIKYDGKVYVNFNLYLWNNPKKNNIPINTNEFALSQQVVISFDPEGQEELKCREQLTLAHGNLEQFFDAFPWVGIISGAVTNQEYAENKNLTFADCNDSRPHKTIVVLKNSDENSIEKEGNCYILNTKDCEFTKTAERLMIGFVAKINNATL
jgi:hypothetical protein